MKLSHLVYGAFTLLATIYSLSNPFHNWDIIGYTACVLEISGVERDDLRRVTYQTVKDSVTSEQYADLTSADYPLRGRVMVSEESFLKQLDIYRLKPLYIFLIFGLSKVGLSIVNSADVISVLSLAILCLLIYNWLGKKFPPFIAVALSMLAVFCTRLTYLARLNTPDMLSVLILVAAIYCLSEKNNVRGCIALLFGSILVRPENIIFTGLVLAYLSVWADPSKRIKKSTGAALSVAAGLVLAVGFRFGSVDWTTPLLGFTGRNRAVIDDVKMFQLGRYLETVKLELCRPFFPGELLATTPFFVFLGILALLRAKSLGPVVDEKRGIIIIALLTILVRFLISPIFEDRFFAGYHLLIFIMSSCIFLGPKFGYSKLNNQ